MITHLTGISAPVTPWKWVWCCRGLANSNPYPYPSIPVTTLSQCYPHPCHTLTVTTLEAATHIQMITIIVGSDDFVGILVFNTVCSVPPFSISLVLMMQW